MNKQQAQERLKELETEQAKLKAIIEAPDHNSLIPSEDFVSTYTIVFNSWIRDYDTFDNYNKAFETFIALRRCNGGVPAKLDTYQYLLGCSKDILHIEITVFNMGFKTSFLSPCFDTKQHAKEAIDKIGKEAIMHMFKTFSHYEV